MSKRKSPLHAELEAAIVLLNGNVEAVRQTGIATFPGVAMRAILEANTFLVAAAADMRRADNVWAERRIVDPIGGPR